jgi:hypothetical protein
MCGAIVIALFLIRKTTYILIWGGKSIVNGSEPFLGYEMCKSMSFIYDLEYYASPKPSPPWESFGQRRGL